MSGNTPPEHADEIRKELQDSSTFWVFPNRSDQRLEKLVLYESPKGAFYVNMSTGVLRPLDHLLTRVLLLRESGSNSDNEVITVRGLAVENDDAIVYRIFNRFLLISKQTEDLQWEHHTGEKHGLSFTDTSIADGTVYWSIVLKSNQAARKSPLEDKTRIRRLLESVLDSAMVQGSNCDSWFLPA